MPQTIYGNVDTNIPVARTATADGTGTGTVLAGESWITVTSAGANDIVILPPPVPGTRVTLFNVAIYELRTTSPTTVGINGGVGAAAESAIPVNTIVHMSCESATTWKGFQQSTTGGTLALVEVAAP